MRTRVAKTEGKVATDDDAALLAKDATAGAHGCSAELRTRHAAKATMQRQQAALMLVVTGKKKQRAAICVNERAGRTNFS